MSSPSLSVQISGGGKSTVMSLILRFYDPGSGYVSLDGHDIRSLNLKWYRAQIGCTFHPELEKEVTRSVDVGQEPILFEGSIIDNLKSIKPDASTDEIENACRVANAHDFITQLFAEGYETDVGQGGSQLSGGQKQRIAIARAIIFNPSILLLDEATSALDNKAEKEVQQALDNLKISGSRRTTITIAHRFEG